MTDNYKAELLFQHLGHKAREELKNTTLAKASYDIFGMRVSFNRDGECVGIYRWSNVEDINVTEPEKIWEKNTR